MNGTDSNTPALFAEGVVKNYQLGERTIEVLRGIDFSVQ
jgi:hypothetical protein